MEQQRFGQWEGFVPGGWQAEINVRDFIQKNVTPYEGDSTFLSGKTDRTDRLMRKLEQLLSVEQGFGGVLDIDTQEVSSLTAYEPGYLDKEEELIVGLQTNRPLKRGVNPFGGIKMARRACEAYGYKLSDKIEQEFQYRTTHNDGVFRAYTEEMKKVRHAGVLTGLPDAYGRGRIIGDYRRVALYGVDLLIQEKEADKRKIGEDGFDVEEIRLSEEVFQQIQFLKKMKEMAKMYGFDISEPARDAKEAIQWLYFAYLASIKEQNGAAMSLGRTSSFIDIYIRRDMEAGTLDETGAQEMIDHFVMKLRMARHLRTPDYNELFGGDPMWITESLGGMGEDGRTLVTKNTYRFLNTLYNLGPAPEPNLTVLWSDALPKPFKEFCAKVSIDTDAIQYENDDLMRPDYGDDYGIACCVSAMKIGKQMQFFGARCNLPKLLLLALNGGYDTTSRTQAGPEGDVYQEEYLDYDKVMEQFEKYKVWLCRLYINTLNVIHYMHDKYAYEKTQMALHDTDVQRFMACGVAGLSVLTDSLSAIKYAKVRAIRDEQGHIVDFETTGEFPKYGNDDDYVDRITSDAYNAFVQEIIKYKNTRYGRGPIGGMYYAGTSSISANVPQGGMTMATPDGRKAKSPLAEGCSPQHGVDVHGPTSVFKSVSKLPTRQITGGVLLNQKINHSVLENEKDTDKLISIIRAFFDSLEGFHVQYNVVSGETMRAAQKHPEEYRDLVVRVSGYSAFFNSLSRQTQDDIIERTEHTV